MYAVIATFRCTLKEMDSSSLLVNWKIIDKEVENDFHVRCSYIHKLCETFHEDGEVLIVKGRGLSSDNSPISSNTKLTMDHKKVIAYFFTYVKVIEMTLWLGMYINSLWKFLTLWFIGPQ